MAVLLMDGFDQYTDGDQLVQGPWTEEGSIYTAISSETRFGRGQSIKLTDKNFDYFQCTDWGSDEGTVIIGFSIKVSHDWTDYWLCRILDTNSLQVGLTADTAGHLEVYTGTASLLGTSTGIISEGVWYYIELKVTIHASAGTVDLYVNGEEWLSLTGRDTQETANATVDGVIFGRQEQVYYDDIYITDGEVDTPKTDANGFFGPVEVITLMPDGDSTPIDWDNSNSGDADVGTNFDHVNELPKDDTSFVETSTSGNSDKYTYEDLPTGTWDVKAVQPMARVEVQGGGAEFIQLTAGTQVSANLNSGVGTWQYVSEIFDYSTGTTDWTTSDINNLTVEVEYV